MPDYIDKANIIHLDVSGARLEVARAPDRASANEALYWQARNDAIKQITKDTGAAPPAKRRAASYTHPVLRITERLAWVEEGQLPDNFFDAAANELRALYAQQRGKEHHVKNWSSKAESDRNSKRNTAAAKCAKRNRGQAEYVTGSPHVKTTEDDPAPTDAAIAAYLSGAPRPSEIAPPSATPRARQAAAAAARPVERGFAGTALANLPPPKNLVG